MNGLGSTELITVATELLRQTPAWQHYDLIAWGLTNRGRTADGHAATIATTVLGSG